MGHLAAGYAIESTPAVTPEERLAARSELGLPREAFVVARLLQPSLRKWDPMPVLALEKLARRGIDVHYVVREAPLENVAWIKRHLGERARLLPLTTDADEYRQTLAAANVISNHSSIGETFGVALAEGMMAGLPVVTNSQPGLETAQVEHCQHQRTGLLANSIRRLPTPWKPWHKTRKGAKPTARQVVATFKRVLAPKSLNNAFAGTSSSNCDGAIIRWPTGCPNRPA